MHCSIALKYDTLVQYGSSEAVAVTLLESITVIFKIANGAQIVHI